MRKRAMIGLLRVAALVIDMGTLTTPTHGSPMALMLATSPAASTA